MKLEAKRQSITLSINPDIWTNFRVWCLKHKMMASHKVEDMIVEMLKIEKEKVEKK